MRTHLISFFGFWAMCFVPFNQTLAQATVTALDAATSVNAPGPLFVSVSFSSGDGVSGLEYFFDVDPGFGNGIGLPVNSTESAVSFSFPADVSALAPGSYLLFVRGIDGSGIFGNAQSIDFVLEPEITLPNVGSIEYFSGTDPGYGNGISIENDFQSDVFDLVANLFTELGPGTHEIHFRGKDSNGHYGVTRSAYVYISEPLITPNLVSYEYFFDVDPGYGNGFVGDIQADPLFEGTINIPLTGIDAGNHILYIRFRDENGDYGTTYSKQVLVDDGNLGTIDMYDFNGDMVINTADLIYLLSYFGCVGPDCPGDVNGDGVTNTGDLVAFLSFYSQMY